MLLALAADESFRFLPVREKFEEQTSALQRAAKHEEVLFVRGEFAR